MKAVAVITVKLDSQRVPKKNTQIIGNHPLCYYVTNASLQIAELDGVFVYCSDESVKNYIPKEAVFWQRDKRLDADDIKAEDVYSAFTNEIDADIYLVPCTTSPFIKPESMRSALYKVMYEGFDSSFSAKKIQTFAWYKGEPINYALDNIPRTQNIEPVYIETSSFYIFRKEIWTKYKRRIGFKPFIYEVGELEGIDIDTMEDLEFARKVATDILKI